MEQDNKSNVLKAPFRNLPRRHRQTLLYATVKSSHRLLAMAVIEFLKIGCHCGAKEKSRGPT